MAEPQLHPTIDSDDVSLLLAEILGDESGHVSVSVYDTARVVAATPWLPGHAARLEYLLTKQAPDGTWGGPGEYSIVPTLSATEALLTEFRRDRASRSRLASAADKGLLAVQRLIQHPSVVTPDTIAVEIVIPALAHGINAVLDALSVEPQVDMPAGWTGFRLSVPPSLDPGVHSALQHRLEQGRPLPDKVWASLESFGQSAVSAGFVRPSGGAVAGSPSATAAWLGPAARLDQADTAESVRYLTTVQARSNGAIPAVIPITYFEPAWVLNSLAVGHVDCTVPSPVLDRLESALGTSGAPAGPGIPADADDTAGVLSALTRHGRIHRPDALLDYRTDGYFTCFPDERTPSTSTNAHVLEALALFLQAQPDDAPRFQPSVDTAAGWLLEMQGLEGSWHDKWHASPFYATACCVIALAALGDDRSQSAIRLATSWTLDTQRTDGSWGQWSGTIEETSYALQILLIAVEHHALDENHSAAIRDATELGAKYLDAGNDPAEYAALWHAKDLYAPINVIRAARLAALQLYNRRSNSFTV